MCLLCRAFGSDRFDYLHPVGATDDGSVAATHIGAPVPVAANTVGFGATGNREVDGLLRGTRWSGTVTYSFPDSASDYPADYGYGEPTASGFGQISAQQQTVVHAAMAQLRELTNLNIQFNGTNGADIRIARSSEANPTAYAYYPHSLYDEGGDIWFGTSYSYANPQLGNYSYLTHLHELGHSFGLKHSQEAGGVANQSLPSAHDALEYSVMSYRAYVGGPTTGGYGNEAFGFPQTYMMNDILALQTLYGADYGRNSGDTVYTWSPTTGETFVDGIGQGRPGGASAGSSANRVFMTVWDGGGNDTYDLSDYSNAVTLDLRPGSFSITSGGQRAYLGNGHYASGNVYNAYLFNDDVRSGIENAIGGQGSDTLVGNQIDNRLDGGAGNDTLTGNSGDDVFVHHAGQGADIVTDFVAGAGSDDRIDLVGFTTITTFSQAMSFGSQAGANTLFTFAGSSLTLRNVLWTTLTADDLLLDSTPPMISFYAPTAIALENDSLEENTVGAVVGLLDVTDPDGEAAFTFAVSDARFEVAGDPGSYRLQLRPGVALDYETEPQVALTVTATDGSGFSLIEDFTVFVVDVSGVTIVGSSLSDIIDATRSAAGQPNPTPEDDIISDAGGNDVIHALGGNDAVEGGTGNDTLYGDAGNDTLVGGAGSDRLYGGDGDDVFEIAGASDVAELFAGGGGTDTIRVLGTDPVTLAGFNGATASVEVWQGNGAGLYGNSTSNTLDFRTVLVSGLAFIDGAAGDDRIYGSSIDDDLRGGAGNDVLTGGGGNDTLTGGPGRDTYDGGDGDDRFVVAAALELSDIFRGGSGIDTIFVAGDGSVSIAGFDGLALSIEQWLGNGQGLIGGAGNERFDLTSLMLVDGLAFIDGGAGADRLVGLSTGDDLRGGTGNDTLLGNDGDDRLNGGAGTDVLDAGNGDDVIVLAGTGDSLDVIAGGAGTDTISVAGTGALTLRGFDAVALAIEVWQGNGRGVIGTSAHNVLDFSALATFGGVAFVDGGAGNDTIVGYGTADDLRGGSGNDLLQGGDGNDVLTGGAGADVYDGGNGDDTFALSRTYDSLDTLLGGAGFDTLRVDSTAALTLAAFDAAAASIEQWQGNGQSVYGTGAANTLDFSALVSIAGLAFIDGAAGNDAITGSRFADTLRGGIGNDIILGGEGNDRLSGGGNVDTFVFGTGFGHDTITDFAATGVSHDFIQFEQSLFADHAAVMANAGQVGTGVVITFDADHSLTLHGTALANLAAADFLFA